VSNVIEKKMQVRFKSLSPVLFCKHYDVEKLENEEPGDFEKRTWKQRAHYNEDGKVVISGYMIKTTLELAAKLLGKRVGGKKMGKGLSHYLRLVRVEGDIITKLTEETITGKNAFVSANGQVGGGKVSRTFPVVPKWEGVLTLVYPTIGKVLNPTTIMEHFEIAGSCVGIGHWRPGAPSCGSYGRFNVEKVNNYE